jgi:hypothetical protein
VYADANKGKSPRWLQLVARVQLFTPLQRMPRTPLHAHHLPPRTANILSSLRLHRKYMLSEPWFRLYHSSYYLSGPPSSVSRSYLGFILPDIALCLFDLALFDLATTRIAMLRIGQDTVALQVVTVWTALMLWLLSRSKPLGGIGANVGRDRSNVGALCVAALGC